MVVILNTKVQNKKRREAIVEKALTKIRSRSASKADPNSQLLSEEVNRLKRGDFTEEELQNLCHNLSENDRCAFFEGCTSYQNRLFGTSATALLREELAQMVAAKIRHLADVGISELNWSELQSLPDAIRSEQPAHEKGRLVGVRLFDLLDLVVAVRQHDRGFAQHFLAEITRPVSDEEIEAFAQSLLRSPEYTAEDVDETREMIRDWRACEETIHSVLSAGEESNV